MDFQKECNEWLEPYGFTIWSASTNYGKNIEDNVTYNFIKFDKDGILPSDRSITVSCNIKDGIKTIKISFITPKGFVEVSTGDIQFKHSRFEWYLELMENYYDRLYK